MLRPRPGRGPLGPSHPPRNPPIMRNAFRQGDPMKPLSRLFSAVVVAMLFGVHAFAQSYPARPVLMVVPFAAGGAVDTVARALVQKLTETWKRSTLVDNRPGAGGHIAADHAAKAPADGYTLLITTQGFAISPGLYKKLPFDAVRDFAP